MSLVKIQGHLVYDFSFTHWMEKNARQLYFPGRRNTPPPGLLGLNIDTKGNLGSVKTATVKILCHTSDDLELIEANFMTPGITCFLEWGWGTASPLSLEKYQQCRYFNFQTSKTTRKCFQFLANFVVV